ncbi:MAG: hypothetical protein ACO1N9_10715 [Flavobacterium sp.]
MNLNIRLLKLSVFTIITILVIIFIEDIVVALGLRFYQSKDNGAFRRFESVLALITLFLLLMSERRWLLAIPAGFVAGIISSILGFFLLALFSFFEINPDFEISFHIFSCLIFMTAFYIFRKYFLKENPDNELQIL